VIVRDSGGSYGAALQNTALNRLRATGATNMTEAVRDLSYEPFTAPLDLLGIPR
jgi:hypothetical protein